MNISEIGGFSPDFSQLEKRSERTFFKLKSRQNRMKTLHAVYRKSVKI